jgi:hypothetical protein
MDDGPDPYEHGDGDTTICADCGERVDGHVLHPGCCGHDTIDEDDARDGVGGRLMFICADCGSEVRPVQDEDGTSWEEVA